ncbi:MAG: CPBP family intramembrane glutamic endopeptidase [Pirellulales bacterium]
MLEEVKPSLVDGTVDTRSEGSAGRVGMAKELFQFFLLILVLSWLPGWMMVYSHNNWLKYSCLIAFGAGPAISAMIVNRGKRPLLRKFLIWPLSAVHVLAAILLPLTLLIGSLVLALYLPDEQPSVMPAVGMVGVAAACAFGILANPWEEVAWRGFLLVRIQPIVGPVTASLLVGLTSSVWHLPLFAVSDSPMNSYPWGYWMLGTIAVSLMSTLLFNLSGESLTIVSILHISMNTESAALGIPSFRAYALASVLMILGLAFLLTKQSSKFSKENCRHNKA